MPRRFDVVTRRIRIATSRAAGDPTGGEVQGRNLLQRSVGPLAPLGHCDRSCAPAKRSGEAMSSHVVERLAFAGMSEAEARKKAELFAKIERQLAAKSGSVMRWFVPGRIEVLGKHTDYAGGRSLLCAAERGFCVAAVPRKDNVVRITDTIRRQSFEFTISPE